MVVCYLRSSSINCRSFCESKFFLCYILGYKDKQNLKANMGNVTHKLLELLGKIKLAKDKGKKTFTDDNFGRLKIANCSIEKLNDLAFKFYQDGFPQLTDNYKKVCLEWAYRAIGYRDGQLDPRNQAILAVEECFDLTIEEEWAKYSYVVGNETINGYLSLKGTVDVLLKEDEDTIHVLDYKTGRRYDWANDKVKTYQSLQNDKQLLFYYYSLRKRYPDKQILVSIYYINDHMIDKVLVKGGLFTMAFGDDELLVAENMIKKEFNEIRSSKRPSLLSNTQSHFKCKYMCAYSQPINEIDPHKPACLAIREQIDKHGIDFVTEKYADLHKLTRYQDGGGRLAAEDKAD